MQFRPDEEVLPVSKVQRPMADVLTVREVERFMACDFCWMRGFTCSHLILSCHRALPQTVRVSRREPDAPVKTPFNSPPPAPPAAAAFYGPHRAPERKALRHVKFPCTCPEWVRAAWLGHSECGGEKLTAAGWEKCGLRSRYMGAGGAAPAAVAREVREEYDRSCKKATLLVPFSARNISVILTFRDVTTRLPSLLLGPTGEEVHVPPATYTYTQQKYTWVVNPLPNKTERRLKIYLDESGASMAALALAQRERTWITWANAARAVSKLTYGMAGLVTEPHLVAAGTSVHWEKASQIEFEPVVAQTQKITLEMRPLHIQRLDVRREPHRNGEIKDADVIWEASIRRDVGGQVVRQQGVLSGALLDDLLTANVATPGALRSPHDYWVRASRYVASSSAISTESAAWSAQYTAEVATLLAAERANKTAVPVGEGFLEGCPGRR
jgi:hypothetical protein